MTDFDDLVSGLHGVAETTGLTLILERNEKPED